MVCCSLFKLSLGISQSSVQEASHMLQIPTSICFLLHKSGLCSRELREVAADANLTLLRLPRIFEGRWTEFTSDLLSVILLSWNALALFFKSSDDKEAKGFLRFLTDMDNLNLLVFLADTLSMFSRYQKQLQSDSVTQADMAKHR